MNAMAERDKSSNVIRTTTGKPLKIALTGKMRSGKDTFADMLMGLTDFQHVKFSSGITEIIDEYIGNTGSKKREAYQIIGQSMRQIDEDIWVKRAFKSMDKDRNIIVTDLRQDNEYKALKSNGFTIVKIISDENDRVARMNELGDNYLIESLNHETELSIDDIQADIDIYNDSTLDVLATKADILKIYLENRNND